MGYFLVCLGSLAFGFGIGYLYHDFRSYIILVRKDNATYSDPYSDENIKDTMGNML
jgi:hypothetical protein